MLTKQLKPVKYALKFINTDFLVKEVPLLPLTCARKDASHTYFWIEKEGLTTFEAEDQIIKYFSLDYNDINAEGLKDEDAITTQIMSVRKILGNSEIEDMNRFMISRGLKLAITDIYGYGKNGVKERSLHGNSFEINLRNLLPEDAHRIHECCLELRFLNYINYYDNQRFGLPGGPYNTYKIGHALQEKNWLRTIKEMQISRNVEAADVKNIKTNKEAFSFLLNFNPKKLSFYISSYNSYLWNQAASEYMSSKNKGENYEFENLGKLFLPKNDSFNSQTKLSINGYEINTKNLDVNPKIFRRNLTLGSAVYPLKIQDDKFHNGRKALKLSFFLPTGSYATMFIKQLVIRASRNEGK